MTIHITDKDRAKTQWLIEASRFEQLVLWEKWSAENKATNLVWESDNRGVIETIGELANRPVAVSIFWVKIEDFIVGFYEATSVVVDYDMVRKWLKKSFPEAQFANAMNFHLCAHDISYKKKKEIIFYKDYI